MKGNYLTKLKVRNVKNVNGYAADRKLLNLALQNGNGALYSDPSLVFWGGMDWWVHTFTPKQFFDFSANPC